MRRKQMMIAMGAVTLSLILGTAPLVQTGLAAQGERAYEQESEKRGKSVEASTVDLSKKGSITIRKYDITSAEAAGDYKQGQDEADGEQNTKAEQALSDYGMEGVQFSCLRVGNVETHMVHSDATSLVELVYEIPGRLAEILGLKAEDAIDMTTSDEAYPCQNQDVYHYTSQQISDAMEQILEEDNVSAKNELEHYLYDYGTLSDTTDQSSVAGVINLPKTDSHGETHAENLPLGLYLFVEAEVPEQVVDTVDPWFVQLPFTNLEAGNTWLYDMVCYPKNQTGNPTLDKSVRRYADSVLPRNGEKVSTADFLTAGNDFSYADTVTASEGDVLDYILVSKLPHITSAATYLSEYTFTDTLAAGLRYNRDAKIAFYDNAEDANSNNTENAISVWELDSGDYSQEYAYVTVQDPDTGMQTPDGSTRMNIRLTEQGLNVLNGAKNREEGLSDYYMVVSYTATVRSDASVIIGDEGNQNNVSLIWSRTSDGYYNMLEDRNYVYTYGVDLTKTFSDDKGNFKKVEFTLQNKADDYYVIAEKSEKDGKYYVTGKTAKEVEATAFVPQNDSGRLQIEGLEADQYLLTETATDRGYNLLREPIEIDITATDRDVIASVCGVTGMNQEAVEQIVKNYNGGIYDENGNLVTDQLDELTGTAVGKPASETANGRTIGKTDLYVGAIQKASAKVDQVDASMTDSNGAVILTVTNTKKFLLPQTGGRGLYLVTIIGVAAVAGGCSLMSRKKDLSMK